MNAGSSLGSALIGSFAVIVSALLAALFALHRERLARREQAQILALYELQDACLALRQAWQEFASAQSTGVTDELIRTVDHAGQRLDLVQVRIRCKTVVNRVVAWRRDAKPALLGDDVRRVSAEVENDAWLAVHEAVRVELRRLS